MSRKEDILIQVKNAFKSVLGDVGFKLFIFGSQVGKKEWGHADIDIGFEANEQISSSKWNNILDKIEDITTIYTLDVVNFQRTEDCFKKIASQNIEPF